jgi:hypothetical protein
MWVLACLGYWFRPFWGTNPQKTGDRGKSPWIQSGPKKWGLEIQWPQKFRKEWCWLPQIDPAGDFRNMIWWPVRRGLTFLEMVTWNKVRFCTEIRGFPNFFELLDLFRHVGTANIVCVCVHPSDGDMRPWVVPMGPHISAHVTTSSNSPSLELLLTPDMVWDPLAPTELVELLGRMHSRSRRLQADRGVEGWSPSPETSFWRMKLLQGTIYSYRMLQEEAQ